MPRLVSESTWNIVSRSVSVFHVEHCARIVLVVPHKQSAMNDLSVPRGTFCYIRPAVPQERSQLGRVRALRNVLSYKQSGVPYGTALSSGPIFHVEHHPVTRRCSTWNIVAIRNVFQRTLVLEFVLLSVIMNYTKTALWLNKGAVS